MTAIVDVPTCGLDDPAGQAIARAAERGWPLCVVINHARVVAGRLLLETTDRSDERPASEATEPGSATIRAHEDLAATLARMADRHVAVLLVTTPEGRLLGALRRTR